MVRRLALLGLVVLAVAGCNGDSDSRVEVCPAGATECGAECVDPRSDVSNCGACGKSCGQGEVCTAGVCRRPCAGHRFVPSEPFEVGDAGKAVAAADADGDGLAELVVADSFNGLVLVPQTSRGVFGTHVPIPEGRGPVAIVAADLDGDGRDDLLVGELFEPRVMSLRNTGSGSFEKRWVEPVRAHAMGYATGDLDGDGHLDIVATAPTEGEVVILHGDGTGRFSFRERRRFTGEPFAPGIGDLDGDGRLDIAFALSGGRIVAVLYGREDGFELEQVDAVDPLGGLAVGDFDGDGLDDLATASQGSVAVLLGRSRGPFERLAPVENPRAELAAGDLDGDGRAEIVALGGGELRAFEVENGALRLASSLAVGTGFTAPVLVDLDGDTILDLVGMHPALPDGGVLGRVLPVYSECD